MTKVTEARFNIEQVNTLIAAIQNGALEQAASVAMAQGADGVAASILALKEPNQ